VKQWSSHISLPRRESPVKTLEIEELMAYIESKKALGRYRFLLIDMDEEVSFFSADSPLYKPHSTTNGKRLS
jgi:hypothetical protein